MLDACTLNLSDAAILPYDRKGHEGWKSAQSVLLNCPIVERWSILTARSDTQHSSIVHDGHSAFARKSIEDHTTVYIGMLSGDGSSPFRRLIP